MRFDWMATAQYLVQYEPLGERDFSLRGFEFDADPVVIDAMKRWAIKPIGNYEYFLRRAYWVESVKADGFVVDLGRDDQSPLTFDEVMRADPFSLSVWYDKGDYSKHFRGKYAEGTKTVIGDECPKCHTLERTVKGLCVACEREAAQRLQKKYHLEHPEIEAARIAKQKAREEKFAAQHRANEEAARQKREEAAARTAERVARTAAKRLAVQEAKLARAAAKEEERIRAARERQEAAAVNKPPKIEVGNKFEGLPCRVCGGTTRYVKYRDCVACANKHSGRWYREKRKLEAATV